MKSTAAVSVIKTFHTKEKLYEVISDIVEKSVGDSDGPKINRFEKGLTRFLSLQWNRTVTKAISSAVGALDGRSSRPVSRTDVRRIQSRLDREFARFGKRVDDRIQKDIKRIFRASKLQFRNRFKIRAPEEKAMFDDRVLLPENAKSVSKSYLAKQDEGLAEIAFTSTDQATVSSLSRLHLVAAGEHFTNNHKEAISKIINEGVFERGLPKKEAGQFLREKLSKRLGGFDKAVPPSIKKQGQQAAASYFEGLSATSVTRARNFGNINLMTEVGILQVIWASILDSRTSQICQEMDGRVFTLEMVQRQQQAILEQETSEGIKTNFGWRKNLGEFGLRAGERLSSLEASQLLADQGVPIVPPAHFRCRAELRPA